MQRRSLKPKPKPKNSPHKIQCPVRDVIGEFGGKWSILVLMALSDLGRSRFSEIRRYIDDISQKMLAETLRRHERDGLVTRTAYSEVPPRVEYELTDLGRSAVDPIDGLVDWVIENKASIQKSRAAFSRRRR